MVTTMFPPQFDPSKLDPKMIQMISEVIRELPPADMMKLQTLMHNQMAGFDTTKEMQEFERNMPPAFREKMARLMYQMNGIDIGATSENPTPEVHAGTINQQPTPPIGTQEEMPTNLVDARKTILKAVSENAISIDDAYTALFEV